MKALISDPESENTTALPWQRNSPQPEDASGPQVSVDMSAFHSSAFGLGCLHRCQRDTLRWPRYDPRCRCRRRRCGVNLCFLNMTVHLLTLVFLLLSLPQVCNKKTTYISTIYMLPMLSWARLFNDFKRELLSADSCCNYIFWRFRLMQSTV